MGYRPSNIPNTSIQWESQEQWNVGVDLGFLHYRINLTVEWYKKTSSDMLMPLQLPSYMGTSGNASSALAAPKGNYGDIENTGFCLLYTSSSTLEAPFDKAVLVTEVQMKNSGKDPVSGKVWCRLLDADGQVQMEDVYWYRLHLLPR